MRWLLAPPLDTGQARKRVEQLVLRVLEKPLDTLEVQYPLFWWQMHSLRKIEKPLHAQR